MSMNIENQIEEPNIEGLDTANGAWGYVIRTSHTDWDFARRSHVHTGGWARLSRPFGR